jgi:hypothetical protein
MRDIVVLQTVTPNTNARLLVALALLPAALFFGSGASMVSQCYHNNAHLGKDARSQVGGSRTRKMCRKGHIHDLYVEEAASLPGHLLSPEHSLIGFASVAAHAGSTMQ